MVTQCTEANWKPGQEEEQKVNQGNWQVQEGGKDTEQETTQEQEQQQKGEHKLEQEEKHEQENDKKMVQEQEQGQEQEQQTLGCTMCHHWEEKGDKFTVHINIEEMFRQSLDISDNSGLEFGSNDFEEEVVERTFREDEEEEEVKKEGVGEAEGDVDCWLCGEKMNPGDEYMEHLAKQHKEDTLDMESSFELE